MIGTIIGLLLVCIIAGFIIWAVQQLIALVPLGEPFATLAKILIYAIILIVVIYAISVLLGMIGINVGSWARLH
jgi:hypothetical protein